MLKGTVKWFNNQKGFGFIEREDGSSDAFVHISAVQNAGMSGLDEGQKIEFELVEGRNGKVAPCMTLTGCSAIQKRPDTARYRGVFFVGHNVVSGVTSSPRHQTYQAGDGQYPCDSRYRFSHPLRRNVGALRLRAHPAG